MNLLMVTSWVLIMTFGNGASSQKIEGYDTQEHCRIAADIWRKAGGHWTNDLVLCLPKYMETNK